MAKVNKTKEVSLTEKKKAAGKKHVLNRKSGQTLSLDKKEQKKVVKETKKLENKIKDGTIVIDRKTRKLNTGEKRGLIYVGHIPHGFYEKEMRFYFKQFGKVTNVKLCRSSKTGNSKGYGYIEFAHPEVAKIAADTMNNYLMFKKRLIAEYVPFEKRPKHLFDGKQTTLTRIPAKIRRSKQFDRSNTIDDVKLQKRAKSRLQRFNKSLKVLQNLGIVSNFKPTDYQDDRKDSNSKNKAEKKIIQSSRPKVEISPKQSSKSLKVKKSKTNATSDSLAKKSSHKSVVKLGSPLKNDKATSAHLLKTKVKKAKKSEGIMKKPRKPLVLNTQTVKKIARELIRKKGESLINYVTPISKVGSNKKSKK